MKAKLSVFASLLLVSKVYSRHIHSPLHLRQSLCSTAAPFDPSCWDTLGIGDWLQKWNQTVTVCGNKADESSCCSPNEPWSSCFLRLGYGKSSTSYRGCTRIGTETCQWIDPSLPNNKDAAQIRYILRAIFSRSLRQQHLAPIVLQYLISMIGIHDFFSSYVTALTNTQLDFGSEIFEIDPPNSLTLVDQHLQGGLTAALPVLAQVDESASAKLSAETFIKSLQQAPDVSQAIWPPPGASNLIQPAELGTVKSNVANIVQPALNAGLGLLMTDVPTFINFTSGGQWTGPTPLSLPATTADLALGVRTYVTSAFMNSTGWYVRLYDETLRKVLGSQSLADVNAANLFSPGAGKPGCVFAGNGICNFGDKAYYRSPITHMVYGLENNDAKPAVSAQKLISDIVANKWAALPILFDGSANCFLTPEYPKQPAVDASGTLQLGCLSVMSAKFEPQ